jgi:hypothetical protein
MTRVMPSKHEDPWNPKPKQQLVLQRVVNPVPAVPTVAATVQAQARAQVQARRVLRYVENRRVMTSAEAEKKMEEIVSDLFPYTSSDKKPWKRVPAPGCAAAKHPGRCYPLASFQYTLLQLLPEGYLAMELCPDRRLHVSQRICC